MHSELITSRAVIPHQPAQWADHTPRTVMLHQSAWFSHNNMLPIYCVFFRIIYHCPRHTTQLDNHAVRILVFYYSCEIEKVFVLCSSWQRQHIKIPLRSPRRQAVWASAFSACGRPIAFCSPVYADLFFSSLANILVHFVMSVVYLAVWPKILISSCIQNLFALASLL